MYFRLLPVVAGTFLLSAQVCLAEVGDIVNYRAYSDTFSSAGQPTAEQLGALEADGFERIVYVAYSDHDGSLEGEDRIVKELGMEYVHIPVAWDAPTAADYALISAALDAGGERRTLLHCQVNYRASAFSFLYRVVELGEDMAAAKADMNAVWTPNDTWRALIFEVLAANDLSHECKGCDWSNDNDR